VCDMDGFKQINDRFGHLEGNRVLRLFAQALKHSCREYDYVARMGGDEFVVVAPGLVPETAIKKAHQLRELAQQSGREVCGEDILSLSSGFALYPADGQDAEALLAEADRRMYMEKQKQPFRKNRRTYPRMKCRVTIELQQQGAEGMVMGNLTDISLGGCFVETSALMPNGTPLKLVFSIDDGKVTAEGHVQRLEPGSGIAVQFSETTRGDWGDIHRVMEFAQNSSKMYDNRYLLNLLGNGKQV
jgi:diguanylate cyclase (GGDEF)-like protein